MREKGEGDSGTFGFGQWKFCRQSKIFADVLLFGDYFKSILYAMQMCLRSRDWWRQAYTEQTPECGQLLCLPQTANTSGRELSASLKMEINDLETN